MITGLIPDLGILDHIPSGSCVSEQGLQAHFHLTGAGALAFSEHKPFSSGTKKRSFSLLVIFMGFDLKSLAWNVEQKLIKALTRRCSLVNEIKCPAGLRPARVCEPCQGFSQAFLKRGTRSATLVLDIPQYSSLLI